MDHSWRPRPPIQGNNICPTCSISHFPFCPSHSSFNENPRCQTHSDSYMQRPPFEPFVDHYRAPIPNIRRPFVGDPSEGFADRRDWHRSPSLDRIPDGQSRFADYDCRDGFGAHSYTGHGSVGVKRMRIDDRGSSLVVGSDNYANSLRSVPGNERILKLIHDHGNAFGGLPQDGANFLPVTNYESDGRVNGRFEEVLGVQDDYFDKNRAYFHGYHGLDSRNFREERGLVYGQDSTNADHGDRFVQSQYDPIEDSMPHSLHYGRHNGYPAGHFTNMDQAKQREEDAARHYDGSIPYDPISQKIEVKQRPPLSQNAHYATSEYPIDNYHNIQRNFQRLPQSETISMKELHYSHPANNQLPSAYTLQRQMPPNDDFRLRSVSTDLRQSVNIQGSAGHQNSRPYDWQNLNEERHYPATPTTTNPGLRQATHVYSFQPPLPTSPPPPLPMEPGHHYSERFASPPPPPPPLPLPPPPPPKISPSLFPIAVSSPSDVPSSHTPVPKAHTLAETYYANKPSLQASTGFHTEDFQAHRSSKKYLGEGQSFRLRHSPLEKLKVVDASHIFKQPHRATRPDHIVIILRGLPGSGKSYLAKMLRDLEVENGGNAPRVHSMDEYFMTEVEKVEETEVSKSSGAGRGKRTVTKKVMEYCYEPEMEEAYRSSMLKAFKKTLDEGVFSFIIVDDRNLRVADFAQFWATAKRSGYEVYLLEAAYKDPAGCAARNVHGFSHDDIQKMAGQWEEAPSLYLKLDIKSLLHGDDLEESGIKEVDMDMEDADPVNGLQGSEVENPENAVVPPVVDFTSQSPSKDEKKWGNDGSHLREEVKELRSSKWSDDLDEDDAHGTEGRNANSSALSGLIQAYSKEGKSVRWGDQGGNVGFSIGAAKRANVSSLVIGPGSGYNLKSNPLRVEENLTPARDAVKSKSQNIFQERMRAEHESFKAVFDKRRQRICGFGTEEE